MKTVLSVVLLCIGLALTLVVISCDLFGVSIEQRVSSFEYDLNHDRTATYLNFHPTATTDYNAIKSVVFWNTHFEEDPGDNTPFAVYGLDFSNSPIVTGTVSGPADTFGLSKPIAFKMLQDGNTWYIEELELNSVTIVQ